VRTSKNAPSPPTIAIGWALACADQVKKYGASVIPNPGG